jgi:predicted DNA-binding transcriptional regulator YafY
MDANKFYKFKVRTGNCYDSVIEKKLRNFVPRTRSFVTDRMVEGEYTANEREKEAKMQAKLEKWNETDKLLAECFKDKESIEQFFKAMPRSYFEQSQNGHVFRIEEAVQRMVHHLAREGK